MFASPQAQAQAHARSAEVRGARAQTKRQLKAGTLTLRDALELEVWQQRPVLELLGYALIGRSARSTQRTSAAGQAALQIANAAGLGHFTLVADLSPARRDELHSAALHASHYATLRGRTPHVRAVS